MRRTPLIVLVAGLAASLTAGCGGGGGGTKPALADAPRATASTPPPRPIVIMVDRKRTETTTTAANVRDVLAQASIPVGEHDLVTPPLDGPAGELIKIVRLLSAPVTKTVKIPPRTVEKKSGKLPAWSEKVLRKGRPGVKVVQIAYVRRHGKKVKAVVAEKIKRKAVSQIVARGPQPSSTGGAAARLNWAGLAKCESGGNPKAVNGPGGYYGLYQFSIQTWTSVGGTGRPSDATPAEQTYRAQLLYNKVGGRWQGQWPQCGRFL